MARERQPAAADDRLAQAERLYEEYGRPLEGQHPGEYLAVSAEGTTLLAPTLVEATRQAAATFGPGNFIFKIGERAVGTWRRIALAP